MSATYAPLEIKQAGESLALANLAANSHDSQVRIDHLAYLAHQKIAVAGEIIKLKSAQAEVVQAGKLRDKLLLDRRTFEADQLKIKAENARSEAMDAKRSKQLALDDAAQANRNTALAQNQAVDSKKDLKAAQSDAANAKLKTQLAVEEVAQANRKTQLARNQAIDAQKDALNAQTQAVDAQQLAQAEQLKNTQLETQLNALAAKQTSHGMVITLNGVFFKSDQARLNAYGMHSLNKLAKLLQENPQRTVLVEGFTDNTGSTAHNQALSERRANSVRIALVGLGVAKERIEIHGYGEEMPTVANDSVSNRQINRRVEIVLSDDKGTIIPR